MYLIFKDTKHRKIKGIIILKIIESILKDKLNIMATWVNTVQVEKRIMKIPNKVFVILILNGFTVSKLLSKLLYVV